jgi:hypothetical protein
MLKKVVTISILTMFAVLGLPAVGAPNCTNQVPTMSYNTSAVSTSGVYNSSYLAWKAFDAEISSNSMWLSQVWESPAWIAYDFGVSRYINRYQITYTNGSLTSRAPMDFDLQGWNGSWWVTLDTRTNQTGWVSGSPRIYSVAWPGNYTKYKLRITDDNDSHFGVVVISIGDLQFQRCDDCGNGLCERDETSFSCPQDCNLTFCGNGVCEFGESCLNCSADCHDPFCVEE